MQKGERLVRSAGNNPQLIEFGERLRQLLRQQNLSQSGLARIVFGETTDAHGRKMVKGADSIARYVSGRVRPSRDTLQKIASALKIDFETLAAGLEQQRSARIQRNTWQQTSENRGIVHILGEFDLDIYIEMMRLVQKQNERTNGSAAG